MSAIFKKEHLKLFDVVEGECTSIVKVAGSVKPEYLIEDGKHSRYLVNLRVGTEESLEQAVGLLGARKECDFTEVRHCFFTGALWHNQILDLEQLPSKGENIIATFSYNEDEELVCNSLTLIPRTELKKFNPDAYNYAKSKLVNLLRNVL